MKNKKSQRIALNLLILINSIFLTSCSTYQFVTIEGNMPKNENLEYFYENDTLRVIYSFSGVNCPISIKILNKLNQPLFIDWSKSAAIIDSLKLNYWNNVSQINATSNGYTIGSNSNVSVSSSDIHGSILQNERIGFIPPQSYITFVPINLQKSFLNYESGIKDKSQIYTTTGIINQDIYSFGKDFTPLKFRSYLTISLKDDISSPVTLDNTFWVSNIMPSMAGPDELLLKPSNQFYIERTTGFGKVMGWTFIIALLIGLAALQTPAN